MFFEGRLAGCEVKWSKRMTLWCVIKLEITIEH